MKNWFLSLLAAGLAGLLPGLSSAVAVEQALTFDAAWIRAMPPGMKMTAGFGRLHNASAEAIELTAFASAQFGDVSLHRTELVDGVSRMREVPSLVIPPGESVTLEPGGYHLMLMMPAESLAEGARVTLDVSAEDGRVFRFELPVVRR